MSLRIGVLASGRGSNLQSLLDAQRDGRIRSRVEVVVSDVVDAKALDRARAAKVPAEAIPPPADIRGPERRRVHEERVLKVLRHFRVDLVVLAGYMRILSPHLVRAYPERVLNVHPALLPSFPGVHAQEQAVKWGARIAGCTTHLVDEEVDHGPILLQAALPVRASESPDELSARILALEHQLLPRSVNLLEQGRVKVEGRIARIDADESWTKRFPPIPGALYSDGY